MEQQRGIIRFQFLGVWVSIHPFSWVMLAILGGLLDVSDGQSLSRVAIFMVAGMLCLLVHEYGHALVGRRFGMGEPVIQIAGLGGMTYHPFRAFSRVGYFLTVLAGPLATLLPGLLAGLALGLQVGDVAAGLQFACVWPLPVEMPMSVGMPIGLALQAGSLAPSMFLIYSTTMLISFWWAVLNLLPIFPLDGGRLLGSLLRNERLTCIIGFSLAVVLTIWCALSGSWFNFMIAGYLAWMNWQQLRRQ